MQELRHIAIHRVKPLFFSLHRESGAYRGDRQVARHAEEGPFRQAQGLRLQGGDAYHPVRATTLQLTAVRALRERGQAV